MEEVVWAAAAAVVALVPPVRRRFLPVSKAVLSASLGVAAAALRGVEGIVLAAACGDQPAPKTGTDAANGQVTAAPRPKRARAASTKPL
ncbi:MAG TPA: hypothetical protein VJ456_04515 [Acidimicrobiia bacterium]|nr:hypothetical protein [Acidimicrobiia bacterium]